MVRTFAVTVLLIFVSSFAWGDEAVTRQDADACEADSHRLCDAFFPDAKRVADCMVDRRAELSTPCAEALARPRDGADAK